ncbi:hypothetical protein MBLNU457_6163t2 [Dothideomycetes sp. NU457]
MSVEGIFGFEDSASIDPQLLNGHTISGAENDDFMRAMSEDSTIYEPTSITSIPAPQWQDLNSFQEMPPPAPHYQEQMMRHRRSLSQPPEDIGQPPPIVFHRGGQLLGESVGHGANPAIEDLRRRLLRDRQANNTSRNRRGRSRPYPDPRAPRGNRPGLRHSATEPSFTDHDNLSPAPSHKPFIWQQVAPQPAAPSLSAPTSAPPDQTSALQTIINRLTTIARASEETKTFLAQHLSTLPASTSTTATPSELEAKRTHNRSLNASVTDLNEYLIALPLSVNDLDAGDVSGRVPVNGNAVREMDEEELDKLMDLYGLGRGEEMLGVEKRIAWCRFLGCGRGFIEKVVAK